MTITIKNEDGEILAVIHVDGYPETRVRETNGVKVEITP